MAFWNRRDQAEEKKEDDTQHNKSSTITTTENNNDFRQENTDTLGMNNIDNDEVLDVVIIGAGWAGISAGTLILCWLWSTY